MDTSLPAIERGVDDLMNNCHSCHTLKYITYRDLAKFGIDKKKIDEWRGDQPLDAPLASLMSDEAAMQSFGLGAAGPEPDDQGTRGRAELCVFLPVGLLQHAGGGDQQSHLP